MVTIYKKFDKKEVDSRPKVQVSETDKNSMNTTLNNFLQYFTTKHLS